MHFRELKWKGERKRERKEILQKSSWAVKHLEL